MSVAGYSCTANGCSCGSYEHNGRYRPSGIGRGKPLCVCGHIDQAHGLRDEAHAPRRPAPTPSLSEVQEFRGRNGILVLTPSSVIIKRGVRGAIFTGSLRGVKEIPYASIVAVQLKKSGLTAGYLQLTIQGGPEAKGGVNQALKDENTVLFGEGNDKFARARELILERMRRARGESAPGETKACPDCAETIKAAAKVCRFCGYRFA